MESFYREQIAKLEAERQQLIIMRGNASPDAIGGVKNRLMAVEAELARLKKELVENIQKTPQPSSKMSQPIKKILMVTAHTGSRLDISKEHSEITIKLQNQPPKFDFQLRKSLNINEFKELPEVIKPDILHFSGHGEQGGNAGIYLLNEDKNGESLLKTQSLGVLFEYFQQENLALQLVLLNACYSANQAEIIAKYVQYVIGTTTDIGDKAAIAFSRGFYFRLEKEFNIEHAFRSGRTEACLVGAEKKHFILYKDSKKMNI
ncbi:MAG: hypothetical protein RLZZ628_1296 [Bacteroidota bacterium]|jgi:hypothetical protein